VGVAIFIVTRLTAWLLQLC